jgi:hypothetical protein
MNAQEKLASCMKIYDGPDKHMGYNYGVNVIHLKQFWIPLKGQDRSCKYSLLQLVHKVNHISSVLHLIFQKE